MSDLLKPTLPSGPAQTFHFVRPLCKGFFSSDSVICLFSSLCLALQLSGVRPTFPSQKHKKPASNRLLLNPYFDPNELTYVTSYGHKGVAAPPQPSTVDRYIVISLSSRVYFAREPFVFRLMRFCQTHMFRRNHRVKTVLKQLYKYDIYLYITISS